MDDVIEVVADSVESGIKELRKKIPTGYGIQAEQVISDGRTNTLEAAGDSKENALMAAEAKLPKEAEITQIESITKAGYTKMHVYAFDEEEVKSELRRTKGFSGKIKSLNLHTQGTRGLLGLGKKPSIYDVEFFRNEIIKVTYKHKAKIRAKLVREIVNTDGKTELMQKIDRGSIEEIKRLIQSGANVNAKDRFGKTPLIQAAFYGQHEVIKLLLEYGADWSLKDNNCQTSLTWAKCWGQIGVIQILKNNGIVE